MDTAWTQRPTRRRELNFEMWSTVAYENTKIYSRETTKPPERRLVLERPRRKLKLCAKGASKKRNAADEARAHDNLLFFFGAHDFAPPPSPLKNFSGGNAINDE